MIILKQQQLFIALIAPYESLLLVEFSLFHINCDRSCEVVLNMKYILILKRNRKTVSQTFKYFEDILSFTIPMMQQDIQGEYIYTSSNIFLQSIL